MKKPTKRKAMKILIAAYIGLVSAMVGWGALSSWQFWLIVLPIVVFVSYVLELVED